MRREGESVDGPRGFYLSRRRIRYYRTIRPAAKDCHSGRRCRGSQGYRGRQKRQDRRLNQSRDGG